jgi:hypothetical protein
MLKIIQLKLQMQHYFFKTIYHYKKIFMKKNYILLSVFFIATIGNAQFKSGEKLLSGNFNIASNINGYLSNIQSTDYTSMSIGTNISIARVKSENKIEGIKFVYSYNSQKNNDQLFNSNSNGYSINYFIQNIKELKNGCFLFLEYGTGLSYGQSKSNQQNPPNTNVIATYKGIGVGGNAYANIGAGYRINKRLVCDITYGNIAYLGYNHSEQSTNNNNKSKQNSWQISSSLSQISLGGLGFGLRWIF